MTAQDLILVDAFISRVNYRPKRYPDYESVYADVLEYGGKLSGVLTNPDYEAIASRVWKFVSTYPGCYTYPKT